MIQVQDWFDTDDFQFDSHYLEEIQTEEAQIID